MLKALLEGKATPEQIAPLARRSAKRKIPEIMAALEGHRMSDLHRQMIGYSLDHLGFLEEPLQQLDKQIVAQIEARGYTGPWLLWQTVPGSKKPAPSVY